MYKEFLTKSLYFPHFRKKNPRKVARFSPILKNNPKRSEIPVGHFHTDFFSSFIGTKLTVTKLTKSV